MQCFHVVNPFPGKGACGELAQLYRAVGLPVFVELAPGIPPYLFAATGSKTRLKALAKCPNRQCENEPKACLLYPSYAADQRPRVTH